MVKADYTYRVFLVGGIFFIGLLVMWSFLPMPPAELQHFVMLCWLLIALVYLLQAWRLKPLQLRRQMAATGAVGMLLPLATVQPIPNLAALPLPFTIRLRPQWPAICMTIVAIWLLPLGIFSLFWPYKLSDAFPFILLVGGFFLVPLAALMGGIFIWQGYTRIEVYDAGLRFAQGGHDTFIRWNETRLFAIFSPNLLNRRTSLPISYELSSRYGILRIPRVYRKITFSQFFLPVMVPRVPFDDYDRQMDALLSLIAAKTGLPLYDLR